MTSTTDAASYRRDAVPIGPFAEMPEELWNLIARGPDGSTVPGAAGAAWLRGALDAAGVVLSDYDRAMLPPFAADCGIPAVQVVTGWVARARRPERPTTTPDARRGAVDQLLDALSVADVRLGAHDLDLVRHLVEDGGPPAARAVAGWLRRVGERSVR